MEEKITCNVCGVEEIPQKEGYVRTTCDKCFWKGVRDAHPEWEK